jgi:hypothetical protein
LFKKRAPRKQEGKSSKWLGFEIWRRKLKRSKKLKRERITLIRRDEVKSESHVRVSGC